MFHRPAKDWPRINYELVHRSALHLLIGNQPANAIQKEDTEGFILERAHRGNQMPQQLLVAWIDYSLSLFPARPFERYGARASQESRHRAAFPATPQSEERGVGKESVRPV